MIMPEIFIMHLKPTGCEKMYLNLKKYRFNGKKVKKEPRRKVIKIFILVLYFYNLVHVCFPYPQR